MRLSLWDTSKLDANGLTELLMRILIDIGHPAHIHYFKNCCTILQRKGHSFLFVVRERDSTIELIRSTGFNYVSRGKGGVNMLSKLALIPIIDWRVFKTARKFKPDLFMSFSSHYAGLAAWLMNKPHIALDDTEHAVLEHIMYRPFASIILSPSCYNRKICKKQILFNSYLDFAYLHPRYFQPNYLIRKILHVEEGQKVCIFRFISWDANHDVSVKGLSYEDKVKLVNTINQYCKVFISSEQVLPKELLPYKLNIHPSMLHSVLAIATLYIGEGGTTATEAAVLGTPAICVNALPAGVFVDLNKYGLFFQLLDVDVVIAKAIEIFTDSNSFENFKKKSAILRSDKIDTTAFLVWFIEHYPESKSIMKNNPDYQFNFK